MTFTDIIPALIYIYAPLIVLFLSVAIIGGLLFFAFLMLFRIKGKSRVSQLTSLGVSGLIFTGIFWYYFVPPNFSGDEEPYPVAAFYSFYPTATGIAWSPDGKKLAISYNAGNKIAAVDYQEGDYHPWRDLFFSASRLFSGYTSIYRAERENNMSFIDAEHVTILPPRSVVSSETMNSFSIIDVRNNKISGAAPSFVETEKRGVLLVDLISVSFKGNTIASIKGNYRYPNPVLEVRNLINWTIISQISLGRSVVGIDISNTGKYVAVSGYSNSPVRIYDVLTGNKIYETSLCNDGSGSGIARYSPDENHIVVSLLGARDSPHNPEKPGVCVIDWKSDTVVKKYAMGQTRVSNVFWSYDGKYLSYLDENSFLNIEDFSSSADTKRFIYPASSTSWSPVSDVIAVISDNAYVTVYHVK